MKEVQCLAYNVDDGLARLRGISSEKEVRASWNPRIVSLGQLTQFIDTNQYYGFWRMLKSTFLPIKKVLLTCLSW